MYLLDTNVVSEFRKGGTNRIDRSVEAWSRNVREEQTFLSVVTIMELERWVLLKARKDAVQADRLRAWMDRRLLPRYENRILDIDETVARRAATLHIPDPKPHPEAFIAATALARRLTVVTRNVRHFEPMGVPLLNPWEWVQ